MNIEYPESIKKIHKAFYTASDFALEEAKKILSEVKIDAQKQGLLSSLGFEQTKELKEMERLWSDLVLPNDTTSRLILTYKEKYPTLKFITKENVIKLCKKYKLILGPSSLYTGFVPKAKLVELHKAYNLIQSKNDLVVTYHIKSIMIGQYMRKDSYLELKKKLKASHNLIELELNNKSYYRGSTADEICLELTGSAYNNSHGIKSLDYEQVGNSIFMVAPQKDFNLKGYKVKDNEVIPGRKLFKITIKTEPDPLGLIKVRGGFLIGAAWGPEASDPLVVNEINN